jgi:hypothetical protein
VQDRQLKVSSEPSILFILRNYLGMLKAGSCWAPRVLIPRQKQCWVQLSKENSVLYKAHQETFLSRTFGGDEA